MSIAVIAHRCGTDRYPEQTLASARYSYAAGADYVEMDIRFTKDGQAVICHDSDAARVFGEPVQIGEITLETFKALRHQPETEYGTYSLRDIFEKKVAPILFHIKQGGDKIQVILDIAKEYGYLDKIVMGCQKEADVIAVKEYDPSVQVLSFMHSVENIDAFIAAGSDIIRLWEPWITQERIDRIHAAGRKVWIMSGPPERVGVTTDEALLQMAEMGVDGILHNTMDQIIPLLKNR